MFETNTISVSFGTVMFFLFQVGTIIFVKPNFIASLILFSIKLTDLTSPVNPISPIATTFFGITTFLKLDAIARAIPKSHAGSSIRIPPVIFT